MGDNNSTVGDAISNVDGCHPVTVDDAISTLKDVQYFRDIISTVGHIISDQYFGAGAISILEGIPLSTVDDGQCYVGPSGL